MLESLNPMSPPEPRGSALATQDNSYDLLRLALAMLVLYSHMHNIVPQFGAESFTSLARNQTAAGTLAVLGFFGLSGYLVTESYQRCSNPVLFLVRRALRIMPGHLVCLAVTAFVIAPAMVLMHSGTLDGYRWTGSDGAFSFFHRNALLSIKQWAIAGVPSPGIGLNGSLWSLFPEFCCYVMLTFLGTTGLLGPNRVWLLLGTCLVAAYHVVAVSGAPLTESTLPTLLGLTKLTGPVLAFLVGANLSVWHDHLVYDARTAIFFGAATLVTLRLGGYAIAAPLLVPLALLHLGRTFSCRLPHDLSYGIYIYGCPAQQFLALIPLTSIHPAVFLLFSGLLATALASVSWFVVERPFIRLARRVA